MLIFPAIDLYEGKAVRLYKGDYAQMTVYNDNPLEVARDFVAQGATHLHVVDLEGARSGETPNFETVRRLKAETGLFCEVGGGVRSHAVIDRYREAGVDRIILGTAAVTEPGFVEEAVRRHGEHIAVGVDIKDGMVAVKGWTERSSLEAFDFCETMQKIGVKTLICTDISRDGAMQGTNLALYRALSRRFLLQIVASGGVSSIEDVKQLAAMELYGAIVGKAYYTGTLSLREAIEVAR